jgi:hypothetical protein
MTMRQHVEALRRLIVVHGPKARWFQIRAIGKRYTSTTGA